MTRSIIDLAMATAFSILPAELRSAGTERLVFAIGLYESAYHSRRPGFRSSRRGFWRLTPEHVAESLKFTKGRGPLVHAAKRLGYSILQMERGELLAALEHNDVFGAVVACCMCPPLPADLDAAGGWEVYQSVWRSSRRSEDADEWARVYDAAGLLLTTDGR